ncbi:MAG: hydroxyacid dehydrogenase [Chromatiaceae bacterium]|nr:hydroxyacid dehydrogenase [Gammaproteobacteria bacterium]MCP5313346.1 hydroxyacid dehydrogenase [Chromatiaceae bacterium]
MADVVIAEFMDQAAVDGLAGEFEVLYDPDLVDHPDQLSAAVADARALIVRNRTQVRGALLDACKILQVVGRLGVGLDNIDLEACRERGVAVCPATGANDVAVAEYVVATAMLLLRDAYLAGPAVIAGEWPRQRCMGREIGGKRLGLIGFGGIARETARRARALGMQVMAFDPFVDAGDPAWRDVERAELDTLLRHSDVVSLHVPLSDTTRGLLDGPAIAKMKPGAVLVNTARGGIVDEDALVGVLKSGHLAGAAIDVFAEEPVAASGGARFAGVDNLVLTPHIAGVTRESNERVSAVTADNVRNALRKR